MSQGNTTQIYLVAHLKSTQGNEDTLRDHLTVLVPPSRAEAGCIQYDLHVEAADPSVFVVYEIWRDQQALDEHAASAHFQAFLKSAESLLAAPLDVKILKRIV